MSLGVAERAIVADLPDVTVSVGRKLKSKTGTLTVADVARILMALAKSLVLAEPLQEAKLLMIAQSLTDCLQANVGLGVPTLVDAKPSKPTDSVYQFKITLMGADPAIWRRIQVRDCAFDEFHEHIQTAMGWTNSHLHQFEIKGQLCGDPELLEAICDTQHEDHEHVREWIGSRFDPEAFDPKQATRKMEKGLPDWRSMR